MSTMHAMLFGTTHSQVESVYKKLTIEMRIHAVQWIQCSTCEMWIHLSCVLCEDSSHICNYCSL